MIRTLLFASAALAVAAQGQVTTDPAKAVEQNPAEAARNAQGKLAVRDQEGTVKAQDGIAMIQGSMMYLKEGKLLRVNQELKLSEGIVARPDGTVTTKDGQNVRLEEGQMMGLDGKVSMVPRGLGSTAPGAATALPPKNTGNVTDFGQSGTTGPEGKARSTGGAPAAGQ